MFSLYESFLIKNASAINSIENGLRTLTFILPGRFEEAEIASETIYSILNFLGLYHDFILSKAARNSLLFDSEGQVITVPTNEKVTYFKFFARNHPAYHALAMLLTSTQFIEKLVEMVVEKRCGVKKKWQAVTVLEVVKVSCKLSMFAITGCRMITGTVIPDRRMDPSVLGNAPTDTTIAKLKPPGVWKGKRSNVEYQDIEFVYKSMDQSSSIKGFLESKVKKPDDVASALDLIQPFGYVGSIGETLYILRPLVYVLLIKKLGRKSWTPWVVSLVVELSSRNLVSSDLFAKKMNASQNALKSVFAWYRPLETEEQSRRLSHFLLYLLRSPMFEQSIEHRLDGFVEWSSKKPIFNLFGSLIQDYIPLWKQYYYYTS